MLFCYPVEATIDNWLHECLVEIVTNCLTAQNNGDGCLDWPDCIPCNHRQTLQGRTSLRDRYQNFREASVQLSNGEREQILNAIQTQNNFPDILCQLNECSCVDDLPEGIREPAKSFFNKGFELLTDLDLRDSQYKIIHDNLTSTVCPFCGCEYFDAPGAPRHDLDHFVVKAKYPFSAVNLLNLVPMGDRCNSSYKRNQDVLYDGNNHRRRVFNPYGEAHSEVSLLNSNPLGEDNSLPEWSVTLEGDEEAETWNTVWQIKKRYERDVLDREYNGWLEGFATWCKASGQDVRDAHSLKEALNRYITMFVPEFSDRNFLKRAVFEMLNAKIEGEDSDTGRLTKFMITVARTENDLPNM